MIFYIKYFLVLRRYISLARAGKFDGAANEFKTLRILETQEINR